MNLSTSTEFRAYIEDEDLALIYDYWRVKREVRGGVLPARADVDPLELRSLLKYIVLADVVDGGRRIRFRLVGTTMVENFGEDFTGRHLDEIMSGSYAEFIHGLFLDAIHRRAAVYSESRFRWDVGRATSTRRLMMPLASDGETVDMVMVGQSFDTGKAGPATPLAVGETTHGEHEVLMRVIEQAAG